MAPLDHAVELLDRALSYTRVTLHEVTDADLPRRTPCERWDLGQLLALMQKIPRAYLRIIRARVAESRREAGPSSGTVTTEEKESE